MPTCRCRADLPSRFQQTSDGDKEPGPAPCTWGKLHPQEACKVQNYWRLLRCNRRRERPSTRPGAQLGKTGALGKITARKLATKMPGRLNRRKLVEANPHAEIVPIRPCHVRIHEPSFGTGRRCYCSHESGAECARAWRSRPTRAPTPKKPMCRADAASEWRWRRRYTSDSQRPSRPGNGSPVSPRECPLARGSNRGRSPGWATPRKREGALRKVLRSL